MEPKTLTKRSLLNFLTELEDGNGDCLTVYMTPSSFPGDISRVVETGPFEEIREAVGNETVLRDTSRYGTGAVVFWNEAGYVYTILPPFPVAEDKIFRGRPATSPLGSFWRKSVYWVWLW